MPADSSPVTRWSPRSRATLRPAATRFARPALVAGLALVAGCAGGDLPTQPGGDAMEAPSSAAFTVSGLDGGSLVEGFLFLPPLGPDDAEGAHGSADLDPVVEICPDEACALPLATLAAAWSDDHYAARWRPRDTGAEVGGSYLLRVRLGDAVLGAAPVFVQGNARGARARAQAEGSVGVVINQTVPVRFRIVVGAPVRLVVIPETATVLVGESQPFAALFYDLTGAEVAGPVVMWSSADEAVATVAADGLATGTGAGQVAIMAEAGGLSGSALLDVEAADVPDPSEFLSPGNTTAVSLYGGWAVRCLAWEGRVCTHPQTRVDCETCEAYVAGGEWHDLTPYNDPLTRTAPNFCAMATGSATVNAIGMGETASAPRACGWASSSHPVCMADQATIRVPADGIGARLGITANDAYCAGAPERLTVDCAGW
jgi:hypothetical protein